MIKIMNKDNYFTVESPTNIYGRFSTLKDAKYFVYVVFSDSERYKALLQGQITHIYKGQTLSITDIIVEDNGKYKFGKPKRV